MLYFVIYAPISAITLVLAYSDFDCRFTCDEPNNRRKNEDVSRPCGSKKIAKRGPK